MSEERRTTIGVLLAAAVGIGVTCSVYYPGVMSPDSIGVYRQAVTGVIEGDAKTPMLAFLWMWILKVAPGSFGLLLFQNVVFWAGLAMIVSACRLGPVGSVLAILVVGLFPTVFGLLGVLWSDVLLAVSLTLFVGIALMGARRKSMLLLAISIVPLMCGLSARVNASPAIVPLAAWFIALWFGVVGRPVRSRVFVSVSLFFFVALLTATKLFDRAVITRGSGSYSRALQFSFFHDLAGIAVITGDIRLPSRVHRAIPNITLDVIRDVYDPADVNLLIYNRAWDSAAFLTTDRTEFSELFYLWAGAIARHPGAYLRRRADVLASSLQIRSVYYPFHTGIHPNDLGLEFVRRPVYERVTSWLYETRGVFFRGWLFGFGAILVVAIGVRLRRWSAVAVCASGLLYVAPYVVVSAGSDFRYIWWLIVSTLIGALLLAWDRSLAWTGGGAGQAA